MLLCVGVIMEDEDDPNMAELAEFFEMFRLNYTPKNQILQENEIAISTPIKSNTSLRSWHQLWLSRSGSSIREWGLEKVFYLARVQNPLRNIREIVVEQLFCHFFQ